MLDEIQPRPTLQIGDVGRRAGAQVVDAYDPGAGPQQPLAQVGAEKTGSAGDQDTT
jgi:hypothetical protein